MDEQSSSKTSSDRPLSRSTSDPVPVSVSSVCSSESSMKRSKPKTRPKPKNFGSETSDIMVDHLQAARDTKQKTVGVTGITYDERMSEHICLWDPNYPEKPERFTCVLEKCKEYGLIERCKYIPSRSATEEEILKLHTQDRIDLLKGTDGSVDIEALEAISSGYDAIYIHPSTYELALLAAGSTVNLVDSILDGVVQNGIAIIRPPGHHAMKSKYCGYCFYNNVAIAAKHALDNKGVKKILIIDWDVHHGQATQQMFYDDPRVLYFSIHRYEHGTMWPNLRESDFQYIGSGKGQGFNVNVPLNRTGLGNADYMAILHQILLPMAYEFAPELVIVSAGYDAALGCFEFRPDLVIVSAGFDSALGDEKGEMEVTPACYAHLTSSLMGLADGKLAVVLEGGYCLKSLAEGAALTFRTLLGDACPSMDSLGEPSESIRETIWNVLYVHRPFWKSFRFQGTYSVSSLSNKHQTCSGQHWPVIKFMGSEETPTVFATRNCYPVRAAEMDALLDKRLDDLIRATKLLSTPHRVGFLYDERMTVHRNTLQSHPEKPERIRAIFNRLEEFGLIARCYRLEAKTATKDQLQLLHTEDHIKAMSKIPHQSQKLLNQIAEKYRSIYLCPESYDTALLAAGSAIEVVENILNGNCRSGVAVVRPPGHHAEEDEACGFCLFNNTALAAKHALEVHDLKRVLIIDWDVHHGNGIQHMFESDPRVLYISIHRFDNGFFFPSLPEAGHDFVGTNAGRGFNVNIPWNKSGLGDAEYLAAFFQIILPIAYQFNPELVLVAAGFDAARGDPLGGCKVSPEGYGQFTQLLSSLAQGRLAIILEGGYNLESISYSLTMCTKALLGDPVPCVRITSPPSSSAVDSILKVIKVQQSYWSALKFHVDLPQENVLLPPWSETETPDKAVEALGSTLAQVLFVSSSESEIDSASSSEQSSPVREAVEEIQLDMAAGGSEQPTLTLGQVLNLPENSQMEGLVVPLTWCPDLESVNPVPSEGIGFGKPCQECSSTEEAWVCLICYKVFCGRYVNGHMVQHYEASSHRIVLSFSDLSVWCYGCDYYLDNEILGVAKTRAHLEKFGEAPPQ